MCCRGAERADTAVHEPPRAVRTVGGWAGGSMAGDLCTCHSGAAAHRLPSAAGLHTDRDGRQRTKPLCFLRRGCSDKVLTGEAPLWETGNSVQHLPGWAPPAAPKPPPTPLIHGAAQIRARAKETGMKQRSNSDSESACEKYFHFRVHTLSPTSHEQIGAVHAARSSSRGGTVGSGGIGAWEHGRRPGGTAQTPSS